MMVLVKHGGLPVYLGLPPFKIPWWWGHVVQIWTRIMGLREAGAYDPEKMVAPKNIWLNDKAIEEWFEERDRLRREPKLLD